MPLGFPMPVAVLVVMIAGVLGLLGLILLFCGWIGRTIDDHPLCRRCRFDLVGVLPGARRCPECGAGLTVRGCIVIGHRRKIRGLLWAGGMVTAVALLPPSLMAWRAARGLSAASMLPERVLVVATLGAHEPREYLDEIDRRLAAGELSPKGRRRLIDAALATQGDRSYLWAGGWGDYLQAEWSAGNLTEDEKRRYVRQSWSMQYELFPQPLGGGPGELPLSLEMNFRTRGRGGTSGAPSAQIGVQAISGQRLEPGASGGAGGFGGEAERQRDDVGDDGLGVDRDHGEGRARGSQGDGVDPGVVLAERWWPGGDGCGGGGVDGGEANP